MTVPLREYDTVEILRTGPREFDGLRPPKAGDRGTIVANTPGGFAVECVRDDGQTVWLADFSPAELVLVHRPYPDIPEWLLPGASVDHQVFGRGMVLGHGEHKGVRAVRVRFNSGDKALATDLADSVLEPSRPGPMSALKQLFGRRARR